MIRLPFILRALLAVLKTPWTYYRHVRYLERVYRWRETLRAGVPSVNGKVVPWLNYSMLEWLEGQDFAGKRVFEYGSGYGSVWWGKRAAKVVSVELAAAWAKKVQAMVFPNVKVIHCENEAAFASGHSLHLVGADVIIVDGGSSELRLRCAHVASVGAKPTAIVIVDNIDTLDASIDEYFHGWKRTLFHGHVPGWHIPTSTAVYQRV